MVTLRAATALHGFRQHMRGIVADQFERRRILARDERRFLRRDRSGPRDRASCPSSAIATVRLASEGECLRECRAVMLAGCRGARRRGRSGRPRVSPVAHSHERAWVAGIR